MRTSRELLRPLAALAVVVVAILLVSNVAAYRVSTTPQSPADAVHCPQADGPSHADTVPSDACASVADRSTPRASRDDDAGSDHERDEDGDREGGGSASSGSGSGSHVVVVTQSGAS